MPTGYTAKLHDGEQNPRQFILLCARAFGALIHQRDEDGDVLPKHDEVGHWYYDRVEKARTMLDAIKIMTLEGAARQAVLEHQEKVESWHASKAKADAIKARYEAMLEVVKAWTPPTPDHAGLKEFMIKQLQESIDWDGNVYGSDPAAEAPMSPGAWLEWELNRREDELRRAQERLAEEIERVTGRNKWIDDLYESVKDLP